MAITAFVVTAGASEIELSALKAGVKALFEYGGAGSLMKKWFPKALVHGYFQYSEQRNDPICQARNINRILTMTIGNGSRKTRYYGNRGWFQYSTLCGI